MDREMQHELTEEEQIRAWREAAKGCCGEGKIVWPKMEDDIVQQEELALEPETLAKNQAELLAYLDKEKSAQADPSKLKALILNELEKQLALVKENLVTKQDTESDIK